ncbi:PKD domain-containing protein, partial [Halorubrum sp. FL23]
MAVVDGEVEATITVETAGEYGGPESDDDKLRVDSNAGDEVRFHVGSADGPQSESTYPLESGVYEEDLTFPAGTFDDDSDDSDDDDSDDSDDDDSDDSDDDDSDDSDD